MKLNEFIKDNQINEEFLVLGYDMWGWVNPKGTVHLPTRQQAKEPRLEVHHSNMIQKWGFPYGYQAAFAAGWIRWFLSNGKLQFQCAGKPNTVANIKKAIKKIEEYTKNPKKFNYFNGSRAVRAAAEPGGVLFINTYSVELKLTVWKYFSNDNSSRMLNDLRSFLEENGIEQTLKETAGGTGVGGIATGGGTGFENDGIGTRKRAGDMTETHVPGHEDHEVSMAHGDAQNLAKNSIHLAQMLQSTSEQQGLPGWVSAYITLANDYLESVTQYLSHQSTDSEIHNHFK